ncbi:MAG TPA: SRPBCC domain-containing protein [Gaiellaceae bacterium]
MKVAGERTFEAAPELVWQVLNDPARLARTMPGVDTFEVEDERRWCANVNVPLGLGSLKLRINFEKTEERPPEYARLQAKGQGVGAIMSMETQFRLAASGSGTAMHWEADVSIAGPVGSMGQRVLQPIVNQQVASVLDALDQQVREAAGAAPPAPSAAAAPGGEGAGAASEGIHPGSPEAYSAEPEGPTRSTEERD